MTTQQDDPEQFARQRAEDSFVASPPSTVEEALAQNWTVFIDDQGTPTTPPEAPETDGPPLWQSRIVETRWVAIDDLLNNPLNPRIHPTEQQVLIAASLDELGWLQHVRVNVNTQHIIDGHQRVLEADKAGQQFVPVDFLNLTLEEELRAVATLDQMTRLAGLSTPTYTDLLEKLAEQRAISGKETLSDSPAMETFLRGLHTRAREDDEDHAIGGRPPVGDVTYEANSARQIVLHYAEEDHRWVTACLAWARGHYGVDTNTEAVLLLLHTAHEAEGEPDLGLAAPRRRKSVTA